MTRVDEGDPGVLVTNVSIRVASKDRFDTLQAWLSLQERRRVRQWEVLEFLLHDAFDGPLGRLVAHDASGAAPPKPKRP